MEIKVNGANKEVVATVNTRASKYFATELIQITDYVAHFKGVLVSKASQQLGTELNSNYTRVIDVEVHGDFEIIKNGTKEI